MKTLVKTKAALYLRDKVSENIAEMELFFDDNRSHENTPEWIVELRSLELDEARMLKDRLTEMIETGNYNF
jgi:hypothetical protein